MVYKLHQGVGRLPPDRDQISSQIVNYMVDRSEGSPKWRELIMLGYDPQRRLLRRCRPAIERGTGQIKQRAWRLNAELGIDGSDRSA